MLLGLNRKFYHQTVGTEALVSYLSEVLGLDVAPLAKQYLMTTQLPVLEYGFRENSLHYRYAQVGADFAMPLDIKVEIMSVQGVDSDVETKLRLKPTTRWQSLDLSEVLDHSVDSLSLVSANFDHSLLGFIEWNLIVDPDFYVGNMEVNPWEKGVNKTY